MGLRVLPPLVMTLLVLTTGCSDEGADLTGPGGAPQPDPVSYAQQVQPIFDSWCLGCHGQGGSAGLDLRPSVSHENLVGVAAQASSGQLVEPGSSSTSILYRRLAGDGLGIMPPSGSLDAQTLAVVARWIDEGAADN